MRAGLGSSLGSGTGWSEKLILGDISKKNLNFIPIDPDKHELHASQISKLQDPAETDAKGWGGVGWGGDPLPLSSPTPDFGFSAGDRPVRVVEAGMREAGWEHRTFNPSHL